MARRLRQDHPGSWHHVFTRGMARRTVFEHLRDIRPNGSGGSAVAVASPS